MKHDENSSWMSLSEAAAFLGVHYTTLRRWTDSGKIQHMRTPGGRRRFARHALQAFLKAQTGAGHPKGIKPAGEVNDLHARSMIRRELDDTTQKKGAWLTDMEEVQRLRYKHTGQLLLGLLIQYIARDDENPVFLEEARRIGREYGESCMQNDMSITETTEAYHFFRQPILDMIFESNICGDPSDENGRKVFQRTMHFLDLFFLAIVDVYNKKDIHS